MSNREFGHPPSGYRLPDDTTLGRAVFQVADLSRSVDFYTGVVGLRVVGEGGDAVTLGAGDSPAPILELRERRGARPVPREGRLGLFHVALLVPDRPSLARVLAHLIDLDQPPAMSDHFVSEALYLWDPDGLGLEIYADRPRTLWRGSGRELYMTTGPLDVRHLLSEPRGEWTGLPAGTRVGHVHLSVDALDTAAAFYHEGLGFDRMVWSYPGALFLSAGGYHHHLGLNTWSARTARRATDDDARLIEWEVGLPDQSDVAATRASIERAGARPEATDSGWRVTDPSGVGLRVDSRAS